MKQESTVADNCNLLLFTCPQPGPVEKWEKVRNNLWHCYDHTCNQIIAKAFQMSSIHIQPGKEGEKDINESCGKH